jgi:hypothetical protein
VSPSTLEVTSVFEINLNYSTLSPQRLHFRESRDEVAHKLFNGYEHSYCEHGVEVDHDFGGSSIHRKSLLLSGSKVGTVVGGMLSDAAAQPGATCSRKGGVRSPRKPEAMFSGLVNLRGGAGQVILIRY